MRIYGNYPVIDGDQTPSTVIQLKCLISPVRTVKINGRLIYSQGIFTISTVHNTLRDSAQPLINCPILYLINISHGNLPRTQVSAGRGRRSIRYSHLPRRSTISTISSLFLRPYLDVHSSWSRWMTGKPARRQRHG
jgi:hypothetical protein